MLDLIGYLILLRVARRRDANVTEVTQNTPAFAGVRGEVGNECLSRPRL